jgi:hypothetical protein
MVEKARSEGTEFAVVSRSWRASSDNSGAIIRYNLISKSIENQEV